MPHSQVLISSCSRSSYCATKWPAHAQKWLQSLRKKISACCFHGYATHQWRGRDCGWCSPGRLATLSRLSSVYQTWQSHKTWEVQGRDVQCRSQWTRRKDWWMRGGTKGSCTNWVDHPRTIENVSQRTTRCQWSRRIQLQYRGMQWQST